mmetsp:Transcript_8294/g.23033  ORF Transcript_8294/g.23033 Transcript_8294/m.23033 type:complete len:256 (+) Transcript_8294:633-1400(+)
MGTRGRLAGDAASAGTSAAGRETGRAASGRPIALLLCSCRARHIRTGDGGHAVPPGLWHLRLRRLPGGEQRLCRDALQQSLPAPAGRHLRSLAFRQDSSVRCEHQHLGQAPTEPTILGPGHQRLETGRQAPRKRTGLRRGLGQDLQRRRVLKVRLDCEVGRRRVPCPSEDQGNAPRPYEAPQLEHVHAEHRRRQVRELPARAHRGALEGGHGRLQRRRGALQEGGVLPGQGRGLVPEPLPAALGHPGHPRAPAAR